MNVVFPVAAKVARRSSFLAALHHHRKVIPNSLSAPPLVMDDRPIGDLPAKTRQILPALAGAHLTDDKGGTGQCQAASVPGVAADGKEFEKDTLTGLNEEAHRIYLATIEAGAQPSELCDPREPDVRVDAETLYESIRILRVTSASFGIEQVDWPYR